MKTKKMLYKSAKTLCAGFTALSILIFSAIFAYSSSLPDEIMIYKGDKVHFGELLKITADNDESPKAVNGEKSAKLDDSYNVTLKLLGAVPIKSAKVSEIDEMYAVVSGEAFGIKIFTKGVMVVGMTDVESGGNRLNPAKSAGIRLGDVILSVDGFEVTSNEDVADIIERANGGDVTVKVQRDGKKFSCKITPVKSDSDGLYKVGIWVRDSSAGLGTMTFYSPVDGSYAALGHAICDVDTGLILPLQSGEIVGAKINSIVKGEKGNVGELCGVFTGNTLGTLTANNDNGLYGKLSSYSPAAKLTKIAVSGEVATGEATIITSIDNNGPKSYECEIERVGNCAGHDMIIRITDKNLIEKTGGIVQGMSGSPILQNGKLVGAITHVFVNDSTKGYAIFAQQMYRQMTSKSASVNN